jgi:hypothetical protein
VAIFAAGERSALSAQQSTQAPAGPAQLVTVPPALSGSSPQLLPTTTPETRNEILGGLAVGAIYDDNVATIGGQRHDGYLYFVTPNFTLQQSRRKMTWDLTYAGGLTIGQDNPAVNGTIQNTAVTGQVQRLFGAHTLLQLRQDFSMTNNPFGQPGQGQTLASVSGTGQLNSAAAVPVATRISFVSTGSLVHQLSRHASVGVDGGFSELRFRDLPNAAAAASLIDGRTITGRMFYAVDISPNQRIGAEYQAQDLQFGAGAARTVDQTLFLFDEIHLSFNMTLTLFGGPGYAHIHNNILVSSGGAPSVLPLLHDVWSPSGGASYTWRGKRLALRVSGSSMVTDGGGVTGAVRAITANGELRRDFTRRWTAGLGFTYSDGRLLEGSATTITTEQATFDVVHKLSQRISLNAQYARVQQLSHGVIIYNSGNHNRASMSLMYQFAKPLGR